MVLFALILWHIDLASLLENIYYNLVGNKGGPITISINIYSLSQALYLVPSISSIRKNNQRSSLLDNTSKMYYNSSCKKDDDNFFEWLVGITDAESSFMIGRGKTSNRIYFNFTFVIALHVDDTNLLEFIKKRLGIGKVYTYGNKSYFRVKNKKYLKVIIDIFTKYTQRTNI